MLIPSLHADTDGCYCTARGYIAYELRSFKTPGLGAPHVLRVVRFDHGIRLAGVIAMQDFQVHLLTCGENRVEIAGYDKGWLKYAIDISKPGGFRIIEHVEETMEQHPFVPGVRGPKVFGGFSPLEVIPLESADAEYKYQLVLSYSQKPINGGLANHGGVDHYSAAELHQIDSRGSISQRLLIFESHSPEYYEGTRKTKPLDTPVPTLGEEVPPIVLNARKGTQQCLTDVSHYDPCAQLTIGEMRFTVAWDLQTQAVTYLFTTDIETDSELSTGGLCRLANPSKVMPYLEWLIATEWSDTARDVSGGARWYAALQKTGPENAVIKGFVQSRYLKLAQ